MHAATEEEADLEHRAAGRSRLPELDALRGAAIVAMVIWHAADGWLLPAHRVGFSWHAARVIGGLAAPGFLFVAGASVAVALERGREPSALARRGLSLVVLGGLLRLAQWALDSGGALTLRGLALLSVAGLVATFALRPPRFVQTPIRSTAATAASALAYVALALAIAPDVASALLRFDVLHCIGLAVAVCALGRRHLSAPWLVALAVGTLALTPSLRAAVDNAPASLSAGLAWIACDPASPDAAWASFPMAPNLAWALIGVAVARVRSHLSPLVVGLAGALVALAAFEGGLPITRGLLDEHPAARPHVHSAFVLGALLASGALTVALAKRSVGARVLRPLGRHSLLIYALHLEFVYGLIALPIARSLRPLDVALGAVLLLAMASAIGHVWSARKRRGG